MDKRIEKIQGFIFPDECAELEKNAQLVKENQIVVEIGSYLGKSTAIFASTLPKNVEFHAIDTWENDAMTEGKWNTFPIFLNNISPWKNRVIAHKNTSTYVASYWYKPIDLLFIDADHSYKAVLSDLNNWYKHLKKGGVLLMHDYTFKEGVNRAYHEFFEGCPESKAFTLTNSLLKVIKH